MSKKMIDYLLEKETIVVFDIDGVLAVYEFGDCRHGVDDKTWEDSFAEDDNPYTQAAPIPKLQEFVKKKGTDNVYVCSQASLYEQKPKLDFVKDNYGIPEDHVFFVVNKTEKVNVLRLLKELRNVQECRIALVEDTVKTLDSILQCGDYATVHISSFFDEPNPMPQIIETGIMRRVGDLGKIVIPKEIRRNLKLKEGTLMEVFVSEDGVFFKKKNDNFWACEMTNCVECDLEGLI